MSRPELPRSSLDGGRSESVALFVELPLVLVGLWELVWLVLLLSGNSPQGQIWSVPGRWVALMIATGLHRSYLGGWMSAEWGVSHPIAWVPVILVALGLAVVAYMVLLWHDHGLPTLGPRRERPPKGPRGGGGGGSGRRQPTAKAASDDELDDSLDTFLAKQAAGRDD